MRCGSPLCTGAVIAIVALVAAPVQAAPETTKKTAVKLIREGDRLFKKGDFAGALARYQDAYAAFPSPKIFYAMAKAEEKLGRAADAAAHYDAFLAQAGADVHEELRDDAQASLAELEKTLAIVRFDVQPAGVTVRVDGTEVGVSPIALTWRVAPGAHELTYDKDGYRAARRQVDLAAGEKAHERVTLQPEAPAPVPIARVATRPAPAAIAPAATPGRTVLWTGVGVTSALAVGWLVTGALAVDAHGKMMDEGRTGEERADLRDRGRTLALTSDALLVGALAAGGFTIWWYTRHPSGDERHARIVPYAAPGAGGLAVVGGF
jgi:hypothetical protein